MRRGTEVGLSILGSCITGIVLPASEWLWTCAQEGWRWIGQEDFSLNVFTSRHSHGRRLVGRGLTERRWQWRRSLTLSAPCSWMSAERKLGVMVHPYSPPVYRHKSPPFRHTYRRPVRFMIARLVYLEWVTGRCATSCMSPPSYEGPFWSPRPFEQVAWRSTRHHIVKTEEDRIIRCISSTLQDVS